MIVSGKPIAQRILDEIQKEIAHTKTNPHLAIVLAGDNPSSRMYIKHKTIIGDQIGIKVSTFEFDQAGKDQCKKTIDSLNNDILTHGIIIQLPLYPEWNADDFIKQVYPQKDVDGFLSESPFTPATAEGIWEMLKEFSAIEKCLSVEDFLNNKKIVILGKGKTAGKPIRDLLTAKDIPSELIDSQTTNPNQIISSGDIIISATGNKNIINASNIKDGAYIIGVGVNKEKVNGATKTYGDIDENSIINKAKLICPTLGGIGPLTIACLFRNVLKAASIK